ncbi:Uncharacterised protein [Mycobacteroides abscessus subsp. massiliense]|nr:Uncharacterised protein [Mycobacteroides abscessus subsp. massiliense]
MDITRVLQRSNLFGESLGVPALPPKRRMHDNGLCAQLLGGANAAFQLRDRVGSPDALRHKQARCVHGQHRHAVLTGEFRDGVDVLTHRLGPHHELDTVVPEPGRILEGSFGFERIYRGRRQTNLDRRAHGWVTLPNQLLAA